MDRGLSANKRKKLQRLINRTAAASRAFHQAQAELCDYSCELYGAEPGDVDADGIIDAVMGGCGAASGMSADDFHADMIAATGEGHDHG